MARVITHRCYDVSAARKTVGPLLGLFVVSQQYYCYGWLVDFDLVGIGCLFDIAVGAERQVCTKFGQLLAAVGRLL